MKRVNANDDTVGGVNMEGKNIIFAAAGFAAGCFFMKRYLKADMERQLDEAYREMDLALQKEYAEEEPEKSPDEDFGKANLNKEKELRIFKTEIKKKAYDAYFEEDEEPEEDRIRADAEREHPVDDRDREPHVISYEQFTDDRRNSKIDLTYYTKVDVLTEEGDTDIIENRHDIIGDALEMPEDVGEEYMSTNLTVYVRNDRLGVDYAISFDDSDAEFVRKSLGMDG